MYPSHSLNRRGQEERLRAFLAQPGAGDAVRQHHMLADSTQVEAESNLMTLATVGQAMPEKWTQNMHDVEVYARAIAEYTAWLSGAEPTLDLASVLDL